MPADRRTALVGRDVRLEGDDFGDCLDGRKIDADDERVDGHAFCCDLAPRPWGCAQIDKDFGFLEEVVLFVKLDQFEGGTGAVAFLLCEFVPGDSVSVFWGGVNCGFGGEWMVPFVKTTFSVLMRGGIVS